MNLTTVETTNTTSPALASKSHYEILDGLRGVAAILVVMFHTFEAYADGNPQKQIINHGYMAVDFFFLLSGFVIAYAYDDRWGGMGGRMSQWEFYKRRLVRLQPMVVMGSVIGAALFYLGKAPMFPLVAVTPVWKVLVAMVIGATLLPLLPSMDIRGWQEMHPLDGPAWSLFYEYLANILYATWLRKVSNRVLGVLTVFAAAFLFQLLVWGPRGDVIGGWAVDKTELHVGFARLLYPFLAGMLLMRLGKRIHVKGAFGICSVMLVVLFALPRFGGPHLWVNGLYEFFCIAVMFPVIVAMGAGDRVTGVMETKLCKFAGDISYPLYITHYPLIYWYTAWVTRDKVPAATGAVFGALLLVVALAIAWACLKLYDEPVRTWLGRRFLAKRV